MASCVRRDVFCPVFLFLSVVPPRPTSTLFPYTTLFRSAALGQEGPVLVEVVKRLVEAGADGRDLRDRLLQDRKSTRLNSSHGYISYAVFCLKKKKKNTINTKIRPNHDETNP